MDEVFTLNDTYDAYKDCRRHKRTSSACASFEANEVLNLARLWKDIVNDTYAIGKSIAFVVTRPKYREVFAADFRDRIVHHYVIMRTYNLFEDKFIEDTYNCRKKKGVFYGVNRVKEKIRKVSNNYTEDCWILKCDLKGFFMSIDKTLLSAMLEKFLSERYNGKDKELVLKLTKMIVMHCPNNNCEIHGNDELWQYIPDSKSLFKLPEYLGMAIGNLTSQIYANFYLSFFDDWITNNFNVEYGRYVDDFIIIAKDKKYLLSLLPKIRTWLKDNLHLSLNEKKFYLQHYANGVPFLGYFIKKNRLYVGKRLRGNAMSMIRGYNELAKRDIKRMEKEIDRFAQRYNSYMGFMVHTRSYNIRKSLWDFVSDDIKRFVYMTNGFSVMKVRQAHKRKNKLQEYAKDNRIKRKLQRGRKRTFRKVLPKGKSES